MDVVHVAAWQYGRYHIRKYRRKNRNDDRFEQPTIRNDYAIRNKDNIAHTASSDVYPIIRHAILQTAL